jgi:hypothetical protein
MLTLWYLRQTERERERERESGLIFHKERFYLILNTPSNKGGVAEL